jgi:hypothetical protein
MMTLCLGLLAAVYKPNFLRFIDHRIRIPLQAAAGLVSALYLLFSVTYLLVPAYLDHFEPTVAVNAELLLRGNTLYPAWESGEGIYGSIYGPVLYFIHATVLLLGKSIFATKFAGVAAIWLAVALMGANTRKLYDSIALPVLACAALALFMVLNESFWNRPEPFLILLGAFAVFVRRFYTGYRTAIALGLISGLAVGLKLHGPLYIFPVVIAFFSCEALSRNSRLRLAAVFSAVAAAVALAPYAHRAVSLQGLINYLVLSAGHGLQARIFYENILFLVLLTAPTAAIYLLRRPYPECEFRRYLASLLFSCLLVSIIASKAGAGQHHLLPFVPLALDLALEASIVKAAGRLAFPMGPSVAAMSVFCIYAVALGPVFLRNSVQMSEELAASRHKASQIAELEKVYAIYPKAEMGVSDRANYNHTFFRVVGILHGAPVHLEIPSLMDLRYAGLGKGAAEKMMERCQVSEWILPTSGQPFMMVNLYDFGDLFSDEFRHSFHNNYRMVFSGKYYNVWSCRP